MVLRILMSKRKLGEGERETEAGSGVARHLSRYKRRNTEINGCAGNKLHTEITLKIWLKNMQLKSRQNNTQDVWKEHQEECRGTAEQDSRGVES